MPSFFAPLPTFLRNDTLFYALNDKISLHFFVIPRFLPYLCKEIRHGLHGLHGFNGLTPMQTRQTLGRDAKLLKKIRVIRVIRALKNEAIFLPII